MGTSVSLGSSQAQGRGSAPLRTPDWLAVAYPPFGQTISYAKCNGNHDQSAYSIPSMREHSDSINCFFVFFLCVCVYVCVHAHVSQVSMCVCVLYTAVLSTSVMSSALTRFSFSDDGSGILTRH